MTVQNPPEGYVGVTPYLTVSDADAAIGWYVRALGAELKYRMAWNGKVGHAELAIGGGHFMLADEFPDMGMLGPGSRGGTTVRMLVYVPDVDLAFHQAVTEGAKELYPLENKPWGDRSVQILDPFGHCWTLATHVEDVAYAEVDARMAAMGDQSEG
ncbi:VOC family protein [Sandaracinobacter neustonicus]|uniref:VOC family protein n=1 Tax=Sandaracinobacter neustonicus TaxID=1715348 RepID=A0A501XKM2_9SPHN|nr:VOC family protein [Sandaracinobacter neustonicus]TPE61212.1 VOC family protein [Sandaracinobacter neustonicus]